MMKTNQLYFGDCLDIMKSIENESVDMVLCDLPYGTTQCKWDIIIPFEPLWEHYKRIIKPNGAIVLFASQPFTSLLVNSNISWFKYSFCWIKTKASGFQNSKIMPLKKHEDILVFYSKQPTFNQQNLVALDKPVKSGRVRLRNEEQHRLGVANKPNHFTYYSGWQNSVLEFSNPSGKGHLHPTQKPLALCEYLINIYTNPNEIVLDNCAGSGTTAVACIKTERRFIAIEKDKKYFDIATSRIEHELFQPKLSIY